MPSKMIQGRGYDNVDFLVVDVSYVAHRNLHAMSRFSTSDGRPSGHVFGAFKLLRNLAFAMAPQNLVFVYDRGAPWRQDLVSSYKQDRKQGGVPIHAAPKGGFEVQEGIAGDFTPAPDVERLFRSLPGYHLAADGLEADDLAAWFVAEGAESVLAERYGAVVMFTADRDYWQLVSDENDVAVVAPVRKGSRTQNMWITDRQVFKEFGVEPRHLSRLKALIGDASDSIRGLQGGSRKGKKAFLADFVGTSDGDDYFAVGDPCPSLKGVVPEWLEPPLVEQRDRILHNYQAVDLISQAPWERAAEPFSLSAASEGSTMGALEVLTEFECSSLVPQVESLMGSLQRFSAPRFFHA